MVYKKDKTPQATATYIDQSTQCKQKFLLLKRIQKDHKLEDILRNFQIDFQFFFFFLLWNSGSNFKEH